MKNSVNQRELARLTKQALRVARRRAKTLEDLVDVVAAEREYYVREMQREEACEQSSTFLPLGG